MTMITNSSSVPRSRLPFMASQLCLADRGYQGFAKLHPGACTPTKKPRKQGIL